MKLYKIQDDIKIMLEKHIRTCEKSVCITRKLTQKVLLIGFLSGGGSNHMCYQSVGLHQHRPMLVVSIQSLHYANGDGLNNSRTLSPLSSDYFQPSGENRKILKGTHDLDAEPDFLG